MAQPRFNGRGFTNPLNPLGFHSENRYREPTPLSSNFMSNEEKYAENVRGNQEFHGVGGKVFGKHITKGFFKRFAGKFKFGKKGLGEAGEEGAEKSLKASLKASMKAQNKALLKATASPTKKSMIRVGGAVIVAGMAVGILGVPLVESLTGADCDDKATDAGKDEGTEEYTEWVEGCQEAAANKIMMVGVAVIGVVGLIAFVMLRPKKSAE